MSKGVRVGNSRFRGEKKKKKRSTPNVMFLNRLEYTKQPHFSNLKIRFFQTFQIRIFQT